MINKGFSLIETFVAITILLVVILGPLSLISKFYRENVFARNQITSAFLAQEGAEMMSNLVLNSKHCPTWPIEEISQCKNSVCNLNAHNKAIGAHNIFTCNSTDGVCNSPMYYSKGNGYYTPVAGGNEASVFHRGISVEFGENSSGESDIETPYIVKIISRVKWSAFGQESNSETVSTVLLTPCQ